MDPAIGDFAAPENACSPGVASPRSNTTADRRAQDSSPYLLVLTEGLPAPFDAGVQIRQLRMGVHKIDDLRQAETGVRLV